MSAILVVCCGSLAAHAQVAKPAYAVRDVRLTPGGPASTIVVRDGRIEDVTDASHEPPPWARAIDGQGMLVLPAFIDAYAHAGCATPEPAVDRDRAPKPVSDVLVDMREANRKGLQPSFQAARAFALPADTAAEYRKHGFGYLLSAPHGQILSGESALATTREAATRDAIVLASPFAHASLRSTGAGYPSTLMGSVAHLRQFLLDARHAQTLAQRFDAKKTRRRPPFDPDLASAGAIVDGSRRVMCEADSAADVDRWLRIADEFHLNVAISGGREAWKRARELAQRRTPVFLALDWGDEVEDPHAKKADEKKPDAAPVEPNEAAANEAAEAPSTTADADAANADAQTPAADGVQAETESKDASKPEADEPWRYKSPLRSREEKRRAWEERRACALRLNDAGVPLALGTAGRGSGELLERLRKLVELGLPREVALQSITSQAARLLGIEDRIGRVDAGMDASFAVWTEDPFASKDARVRWIFVDGHPYEFDDEKADAAQKPAEGIDASGTWTLEVEGSPSPPATAELKMEPDGEVNGEVRYRATAESEEIRGAFEGRLRGKMLRLKGRLKFGTFEADVEISGELEGDEWRGETRWKSAEGDDVRKLTGRRNPK
ncbi:MAG: amidohydrolase family protein [Planctomycetota bacterium]